MERQHAGCKIDIPSVDTFEDVLSAVGFIVTAVGKGKITHSERELLARAVESYSKALEAYQFESRLKSLEENLKSRGKYEACE